MPPYPRSSPVTSSQQGVHPNLLSLVEKHRNTQYQRPIASHTLKNFDSIFPQLSNNKGKIILDSGCGTGLSTLTLAQQNPNHWILGVDKSSHRLHKAEKTLQDSFSTLKDRVCFVQADLIDFWRLIQQNTVPIHSHYLLYPNPWPKKSQIQRRFHGHPTFPLLLQLSPLLEVRSNWKLYLEEFQMASQRLHPKLRSSLTPIFKGSYLTAFEKKYLESEHSVWKLSLNFSNTDV